MNISFFLHVFSSSDTFLLTEEAKFESKDIHLKLMKEVPSSLGFLLQGEWMVSSLPCLPFVHVSVIY